MQEPGTSILIATLGSEPQVVTAAFDLLRKCGENIQSVWVVHTAAGPGTAVHQAVGVLQDELAGAQFFCVKNAKDIDTPEATESFFRLVFSLISLAKKSGARVHLCIAGGRKTMAVFSMAAAQMLFDEQDRLWHLFSSGDFLVSKRLHPGPRDETKLVPVPVILWNQVSPVFRDLNQVDDPFTALKRIQQLQLKEKILDARSFILGVLSAAEQRVVELLVREGYSDQELADHLNVSPRTIAHQLQSVYNKAELHWEMASIGRSQLISLLSLYFVTDIGKNTDGNGPELS